MTQPNAGNSSWTDARIERLKTLLGEGLSASQIASDLGGITRSAVLGKIHRLGLSGPKKVAKPKVPRTPRARRRPEIIYRRFAGPVCEADPVEIKDEDIPIEQRKKLLELTNETCRWPVGDPSNPEFYFCGATPFFDHPYCAAHCKLAYQPRKRDEATIAKDIGAWCQPAQTVPF